MQTAKSRYGASEYGIGASLLRKEDLRHLPGRGEFVSDISLPGMQQVVFLRSPHAHARIRCIIVSARASGRVFTAADLPRITADPRRDAGAGRALAALAAARDRQGALCRRGDRRLRRADPRRSRGPRRRRHGRLRAARRGGRCPRAVRGRPRAGARILGRQPVQRADDRRRRHRRRRARRRRSSSPANTA